MLKGSHGFSFVELMVVVTIISLLLAIAAPNYWHAKEMALFTACVENRRVLEKAETHYLLAHNEHSIGPPSALIKEGYAPEGARCPEGGVYYWVPYPVNDPRYHSEVGCSIHGTDKEHNSNLDESDKPKPRPRPKPVPVPERRRSAQPSQ